MTPRVGMDVEVKGWPGEWLIVALEGAWVRVVSIDAPGDALNVRASECREVWPRGVAA